MTSPGWPAVRESFFNLDFAGAFFPSLEGFKLTLLLFLTAEPVILVIGLALAVLRGFTAPIFTPLRFLALFTPTSCGAFPPSCSSSSSVLVFLP